MAAVCHLEYSKVGNFNSRSGSGEHCASYAKFREDTLNRSGDMADFRFFKMAAAAILDFGNFKFLTVGTLKRVELRLHAKFCRNRSNLVWDMTIFRFFQDGGRPPCWISKSWKFQLLVRFGCPLCIILPNFVNIGWTAAEIWRFFDFFKMAAVRHLGFVGTTHEVHLMVFITVQNLVGIDAVVLIICTFFDFASLAWKRLFTPQNWGKIGEGVGRYWLPTNSFLLLGVYTYVSNLVKIDEEMRPWECPQTDTRTHARTDAKRFYYLSHAICYSYGADNKPCRDKNDRFPKSPQLHQPNNKTHQLNWTFRPI